MKNYSFEILYEDTYIIVCKKPHGVPTQSRNSSKQDMESMIKNHMYLQNSTMSSPYLAVIHRLDQPVTGILVFAKNNFAARSLNQQLQNKDFGKYYRALTDGIPPKEEDNLEDYMVKDGRTNTSHICEKNTPGAKIAKLHYKIVKKGQGYFNWGRSNSNLPTSPTAVTELEIRLDTGRHHQIRVQLSNIDCPIIGDTKYNPHTKFHNFWQEIQLCAYKLTFKHPKTGQKMEFTL